MSPILTCYHTLWLVITRYDLCLTECYILTHKMCCNLQVRNDGDGLVPSSKVVIHWPYETQSSYEHGKHLLYLMEEPLVSDMLN